MLRRFSCLIILKGSQCVIGTARFLPVAVSYESQQGNDMTYLRSQLLGNSGQVYSSGRVATESEQAFDFHQIIWKHQTGIKISAETILISFHICITEYIEVVNVLNTAQSQALLLVFDYGCITYLFSLFFFFVRKWFDLNQNEQFL